MVHHPRNVSRRLFVAGAAGLSLTPAALAQQTAAQAPPPDEPQPGLAAWIDAFGRPAASVLVDGKGPFRFLVDTGATTTVIARQLAGQLALQPQGEIMVNGTTGSIVAPVATASRLQSGVVTRKDVRVAILDLGHLARWDGVLGADMFAGRTLVFDIRKKTVSLRYGASEPAYGGPISLNSKQRFRLRNGRLAEVNGLVGRVRARMILDTGADCSIANPALSQALRKAHPSQLRQPGMSIVGLTGEVVYGEGVALPPTRLGGVILHNAVAIAAEAPVFKVWGLIDEPAMLVGVDYLSRLSTFSIDYRTLMFEATTLAELVSRNPSALG